MLTENPFGDESTVTCSPPREHPGGWDGRIGEANGRVVEANGQPGESDSGRRATADAYSA